MPPKAEKEALFEQLYSQYYGMVLHLCTGFMQGHRDTAHDLAQEVFVNTWQALGSFANKATHKTWLYRITVNTCLQAIRKEKSRPQQPLAETDLAAAAEAPAQAEANPHQPLYRAIGQLQAVDRLVVMLVLDGLAYDEIARITGITEGNLRVKVHRIKQRLKKLMTHEQPQ